MFKGIKKIGVNKLEEKEGMGTGFCTTIWPKLRRSVHRREFYIVNTYSLARVWRMGLRTCQPVPAQSRQFATGILQLLNVRQFTTASFFDQFSLSQPS